MIESLPMDLIYEGAAIVGTAALAYLWGKQVGRRAVATLNASRSALDTVCDAIEDGTLTTDEAKQIAAAAENVIAAAEGTTE